MARARARVAPIAGPSPAGHPDTPWRPALPPRGPPARPLVRGCRRRSRGCGAPSPPPAHTHTHTYTGIMQEQEEDHPPTHTPCSACRRTDAGRPAPSRPGCSRTGCVCPQRHTVTKTSTGTASQARLTCGWRCPHRP